MKPHVHFVTLGVPDLKATHRFYSDGLGWPPVLDVPGETAFIQVGHGLLLGLFGANAPEADIGPLAARAAGPSAFPLAQVVATEDAADRRALCAQALFESG